MEISRYEYTTMYVYCSFHDKFQWFENDRQTIYYVGRKQTVW